MSTPEDEQPITLGDIHEDLVALLGRGAHPGSIDWVLHHQLPWPEDAPVVELCRMNHAGMGGDMLPGPPPGPEALEVLARLSTVEGVQAALWCVWYLGTGLLEPSVSRLLTEAYVADNTPERV